MRNTDRDHTREELIDILTKFAQKLVDSRHNVSSREDILKAGLRKHYRDIDRAVREKSPYIVTGRK